MERESVGNVKPPWFIETEPVSVSPDAVEGDYRRPPIVPPVAFCRCGRPPLSMENSASACPYDTRRVETSARSVKSKSRHELMLGTPLSHGSESPPSRAGGC